MVDGQETLESQCLDKINNMFDKIDAKTAELQSAINNALKRIPVESIRSAITKGWDRFVAIMADFWRTMKEIVTNMGSPSKLSATADAWSSEVGGPLSGQVQATQAGPLAVDDTWTGTAADQYRQKTPQQTTALDKMKSVISDGISTALKDIRTAVMVFWGALVVALIALIGGLVTAIVAACGVVSSPAAPITAALAVATACGAVFSAGMNLHSATASANTTLLQKYNDNSGFCDGHWPTTTTAVGR